MQKIKMKQLVFLCYISRSGSTFLAKELNKFNDIKVGIEGEFNDGFNQPFPLIENQQDLWNYIVLTYENNFSKLRYWNIDKQELFTRVSYKGYSVTFRDFLLNVLDLYFNGIKHDDILIHKAGSYHKHFDTVLNEFGHDTKFLFINRDPRSVYNSQRKSLGSESNIPFVNNLETFVKRYKIEQNALMQHIDKENMLVVQYEELINNKEKTIKNILKFVGSNGVKKQDDKNYFDEIPEKQRKLHKKLKNDEDKSRIAPWKTELTLKENYILQKHLKKYIDFYGYEKLSLGFNQAFILYFNFILSKIQYIKNKQFMPILKKFPPLYKFYKFVVQLFK
jgi:hypothetical protein